MVKNTSGGTKTKGLARKHQGGAGGGGGGGALRLPKNELEQLVVVTKMLGNGMCEVSTTTTNALLRIFATSSREGIAAPMTFLLILSFLLGLGNGKNLPSMPMSCSFMTLMTIMLSIPFLICILINFLLVLMATNMTFTIMTINLTSSTFN